MIDIWDQRTVAPSDWIEILSIELSSQNKDCSQLAMLNWFKDHGLSITRSTLSRLKAQTQCETELPYTAQVALNTIVKNVSAQSCIVYFENLVHKALKFFIPFGNVDRKAEAQHLPLGVYQATRYSFSSPAKLVRSAFLFYRNDLKNERLSGYADVMGVKAINSLSSILRFKEIRIIQEDGIDKYQILISGFVFLNHQTFYAIGMSFETDPKIKERDISTDNLRHVQIAHFIFDDDNDADLIKGIKLTGLRKQGDPAAATIELRRVTNTNLNINNWMDAVNSPYLDIGVRDESDIFIDDKNYGAIFREKLEARPDPYYRSLVVGTSAQRR